MPSKNIINSVSSGSNAMVTSLTNYVSPDEQSYLISPVFQGTFTDVAVEFSYIIQTNINAGATIQYSTDNGSTWMRLADINNVFNGYNEEIWSLDWSSDRFGFVGFETLWKRVQFSLGNLQGATSVIFRMVFGAESFLDGNLEGFAFDDFKFYEKLNQDLSVRSAFVNNAVEANGNEWLEVFVANEGAQDINLWNVKAILDNGDEFSTGLIDYSVVSVQTDINIGFEINIANISDGPYNITVVATSQTDENTINDTMVITGVKYSKVTTFPFIDDFESTIWWNIHNDDKGTDPVISIATPTGDSISGALSGSNALTTCAIGEGGFRTTVMATSAWFGFDSLLRPSIEFAARVDLMADGQAFGLQYRTRNDDWMQLGSIWYDAVLNEEHSIYYRQQYDGWANEYNTDWDTVINSFDELAGLSDVQIRFLYSPGNNLNKSDGFAIDNFKIYDNPYGSDLAVDKIISPISGISKPSNDTIRVLLKNNGANSITNFVVQVMIQEFTFSDTVSATIATGEVYEHIFSQTYDFSAVGQYYFDVNVVLTGDENSINDMMGKEIFIQPLITSLPYFQDFESGDGNWVISTIDGSAISSWEFGTPNDSKINYTISGINVFMTGLYGPYYDNELSYVQSPFFDLSSLSAPVVKLDIWSQTSDYDDGALLQYSINNGTDWITIGINGDNENWYNWTSDPSQGGLPKIGELDYWTTEMDGWQPTSHVIPELAGQPEVTFRLVFGSDMDDNNYDGFAFDNFAIQDIPTGLTEDFNDNILNNWFTDTVFILDASTNELKIDVINKNDWSTIFHYFDMINMTDNPFISLRIKSDSVVNIRIKPIDDNDIWADKYPSNIDIIADGTYHNYVFDFTDKWVNWENVPVDPKQIIKIALDVNQGDPFNGVVYIDDIRLGSDVVISNNLDIVWTNVGYGCNPTAGAPVSVDIQNTGINPMGNFDLSFSVNDVVIATETFTGSINPGDTATYLFTATADFTTNEYIDNFIVGVEIFPANDENIIDNKVRFNHKVFGDYTDQPGWKSINICDGIADNTVWALDEDINGNIWMSGYKGVTMFGGTNFTQYHVEDGLITDYIWTMQAASDGSVWLPAATTGGITQYKDGGFTQHYPFDSLMFVECSFEDDAGNMWFGSYGNNGAAMYDGSAWTHFPTEFGEIIEDIDHAPNGDLLFANGGSVMRYDGTIITEFIFDTTARYINEIFRDSKNITWFYGQGYLSSYDGTIFNDYSSEVDSIGNIQAIEEDANGNIWFGGDAGVVKFDGTNWETLTPADGLIASKVWSIVGASDGNVWFGTRLGISVLLNQVVADFEYVIDSQTVAFTNNSYANSPSFNWNFGDGGQSQLLNPVHTYTSNGFFDVCLTVFDNVSGQSDEYCAEILVGDTALACKAEFETAINIDTVMFTNTSISAFSDFYWNFGDGMFSYDESPIHVYEEGGYYTITFGGYDSITDCYDEVYQELFIEKGEQASCFADFKVLVNGANVKFVNQSLGSYTDLLWSFGDGYFATSIGTDTIEYTYMETAYYEVCLTVYDSVSGCLDEYCDEILIIIDEEPVCKSNFSFFIDSATVSFTSQVQGNISDFMWDFDNGGFSFEANPVISFAEPGFYDVELTVYDSASGCLDSKSKVVIVTEVDAPFCKAEFSTYVDNNNVVFSNTSTGEYTDVFWDYGDGNYSTQDDSLHTYLEPDYYEVTLTIYNSETDCIDEFSKVVMVTTEGKSLCDADFTYFGNENILTFNNESVGNATDYFWNFGDGYYGFDENAVHTYTESGYFEVNLTIYDSISDCIDDKTKVVFVYNPEVAACNALFSHYPQGDTVTFTSEATGEFSQHFWDFDDGTNSNQENPTHVFDDPVYYEIAYTVIDTLNGCFDTRFTVIFVEGTDGGSTTSTEIKAQYSYIPDNTAYEVIFNDESLGTISNWYWDFGENTPANTQQNPVYTYQTNDYYRVCLTVGNIETQETKCNFIAVGDVSNSSTAFFTYFADAITSTGHFKNKSLGNIDSYYWNFGDNSTSEQKSPSHTYADTGYYAVCLTTISATGVQKTWCEDVRIGNAISDPCLFSCVWPGDANNDLEANHYDILTIGLNYGMKGPTREDASLKWYGQFAQNWSTYQQNSINNKHGDCNGDGTINSDDTLAVLQNFAYSHYWQPDVKTTEWEITVEWDTAENSKRVGSRSRSRVQLSQPRKGTTNEIYGIGYEVLVLGGEGIIWEGTKVLFDGSWLGSEESNLLTFFQIDSTKSIIYISEVRTDKKNVTGEGKVADIYFDFKEGYNFFDVSFKVTTLGGIQNTGNTVGIGGNITLNIGDDITICSGDTITLTAPEGFKTYKWSTGEESRSIDISNANTYSVVVTDSSGSSASDELVVTLSEPLDFEIAITTQGNNVVIDAGSGFINYLWSTNDTTQMITVHESGIYSATVTNEFGCTAFDTVNVTITNISTNRINNITVFPNPNNGKFWLVYEFNSTAPLAVDIINVEGKIVWRGKFDYNNGQKHLIKAGNLDKGVYYLKVIHDSKVGFLRFVVL